MPEYLAPGVYVEEVSFRPKSIEGVSTSTTAFVGPTRKGPLAGMPELVTSFGEFERVYGGLGNLAFVAANDSKPDRLNYLAHGVRAFFDNGGKRLYVSRTFLPRTNPAGDISSNGKAACTLVTSGSRTLDLQARFPGSAQNGTLVARLKRTPAQPATLAAAADGTLVCLGAQNPALPATIEGKNPWFAFADGDTIALSVSVAGVPKATTVTLDGSAAVIEGAALADPLDVPADTSLEVSLCGDASIIPIPPGDTALSALAQLINEKLRGGYARITDSKLVIVTDVAGAAADIFVRENEDLGFVVPAPAAGEEKAAGLTAKGAGNVGDLRRVTVEEIRQLLETADAKVAVDYPGAKGGIVFRTKDAGETVTLTFTENNGYRALGLTKTASTGVAGSTFQLYTKQGDNLVGPGSPLAISQLTSVAEIFSFSIEINDADQNRYVWEDLGFAVSHPRFMCSVLAKTPVRKADEILTPYFLATSDGGEIPAADLFNALFGVDLKGVREKREALITGGNDGAEPVTKTTLTAGAVSGAVVVDYSKALELLQKVEDVSILASPGYSDHTDQLQRRSIQEALLSHVEFMKYRFAVLDTPAGEDPKGARDARSYLDSKRAALYYPWVVVANPLARPGNEQIPKEIALPPSGFLAGVYARTDVERGVWKPPANEIVRGALRFEQEITTGQQEMLNPEGVNCLRFFPGRGFRVWGARTACSDPEWKYVNVRRYFIYLERSIDRSTQWAVFEPNGERLWANIRDTISAFLYNEWRSGALLGGTPEEAYFVRCDRSTMTQNDIDNGRLICEIGVAAIKPAEFVIFRIGQKTADAQS